MFLPVHAPILAHCPLAFPLPLIETGKGVNKPLEIRDGCTEEFFSPFYF